MISVIVPTYQEAAALPHLLSDLAAQEFVVDGQRAQIIVVDGGSHDLTSAIAEEAGAECLTATRNRGAQIAAGAAIAKGDVLFFLHADCRLAPGSLAAIESTLAQEPTAPGGNFRLLFDGDDSFSRWLNGFYAFIRRRGFYYGDSGVFVRRQIYDSLGGVRPLAVMEDHDFNRRLERTGRTLMITDPPLRTSSRKFTGRRPISIVTGWLILHALFHLGVPNHYLARLYYPKGWWRSQHTAHQRTSLRDQS